MIGKKKLLAFIGILAISIGYSQLSSAAIPRGYQALNLGALDGRQSDALAVNNYGWAVGWSNSASKFYQATLWRYGQIVALPDLGGAKSKAIAINDLGQVLGATLMEDPSLANLNLGTRYTRIFLWQNGVSKDISTPQILFANHPAISPSDVVLLDMSPQLTSNNSVNDYAASINNLGQVVMVGAVTYRCGRPTYCWKEMNFVYQNGQVHELVINNNPTSSRVGKYSPVTINNSGIIGASAELVVGNNGGGNLVTEYLGIVFDTTGVINSLVITRPECTDHKFMFRGFNDYETAVGQACVKTPAGVLNLKRGFMWDVSSGLRELPILGSSDNNYVIPRDINNFDLVVASAVRTENGIYATDVLYDRYSGPVILNDIISNASAIWVSHICRAINNSGVIVGSGHFKTQTYGQAIMFTPNW